MGQGHRQDVRLLEASKMWVHRGDPEIEIRKAEGAGIPERGDDQDSSS